MTYLKWLRSHNVECVHMLVSATERVANRLVNGEALPGGVPGPKRGRSRKSVPDSVGGGFYTFVGRDGQARWTGVRIGRQAEALWADRSFYVAGVGRL